jgi:hypothetical protein
MTLAEAKNLAQQGIKVTHRYFTSDEYMIMKGNMIVFEDGLGEILFNDWVEGKDYLKEGWSIFGAKQSVNMNYTDKEMILIKQRAYDKGRLHGAAIVASLIVIQTLLMIFS